MQDLKETVKHSCLMREEIDRLRSANSTLASNVAKGRKEIDRLCSANATLTRNVAEGREEINQLRSANAALTGNVADATRRVQVKKEITEATVGRMQKVRHQCADLKSALHPGADVSSTYFKCDKLAASQQANELSKSLAKTVAST